MNIVEDFLILRKQVPPEQLNDKELKLLFKVSNFDIVETLLRVEEQFNGKRDYRTSEIKLKKPENIQKIEELRGYVVEKNAVLHKMQTENK